MSKNILFVLCAVLVLSACEMRQIKQMNNRIVEKVKMVDNSFYYSKIDSFINLYDNTEYNKFLNNEDQNYSIEDSLCFYFSKLDRQKLYKDNDFKYLAGKLIEKHYLDLRNKSGTPRDFNIYNLSIYIVGYKKSHGFALKVLTNSKSNLNEEFDLFTGSLTEFICIDSVVLSLNEIPKMKDNKNHRVCLDLVRNKKTGGCKW
ncbi:hypothetical protein HX052_15175 [Myroides marinus]|uniref:hypothetical protein n=1 Tax=Myroides marinus TaxID=703342 RepID=UPI002576C20A|nr:hypothetical protein [Myroides marinus]MDM1391294.1 hypothetical protein [Myroides marinus]